MVWNDVYCIDWNDGYCINWIMVIVFIRMIVIELTIMDWKLQLIMLMMIVYVNGDCYPIYQAIYPY